MKKEIIISFILGAIISSVVGVIAANIIPSSSVLYKDNKTVNTVLDELYENVDAIESDNTRLTSLEGKVNTLTSTHTSDIARIDNNITSINSLIGSTDISSIGNGTITGAIKALNNNISYLSIGKGLTTSFTYYKSAIFIVFRDSISEIYAFDVYGNTMPVAGTSSNYLECSTSGADGTGNKEITVSVKNNTGAMACGILILL